MQNRKDASFKISNTFSIVFDLNDILSMEFENENRVVLQQQVG